MINVWKYQATLDNGDSFIVSVFSGSRDPLTVIRPDLQDRVIDITTLS